ncbi:MAG TPA: hypothetical protein PLU53_00475 [Bacteroidia bacterium]|nr:hypothetical protein [Bacteroidia bacterium]
MDNKLHTLLDSGPCPDHATLVRYARGFSSAEEARTVELHLAGCPFCSDAVDGLMMMDTETDLTADIAALNMQIDSAATARVPKIAPIRPYLRIAASLALLFVSIGALYFFLRSEKQTESENALANAVTKMDSVVPKIVPAMTESDQEVHTQAPSNNLPHSPEQNSPGESVRTTLGKKALPSPPFVGQPIERERKDAALDKPVNKIRDIADARNLAEPIQGVPGSKRPSAAASEISGADEAVSLQEDNHTDSKTPAPSVAGSTSTTANELKDIDDVKEKKSAGYKKEETLSNDSRKYTAVSATSAQTKSIREEMFGDAVKMYDQGKYSRALSLFNSIAKSDSLRADEANWFQALIYIRLHKPEKARPLLEALSSKTSPRKQSADSLLKTLD